MLTAALADDADFAAAKDLYRELKYEQAIVTFERLSVNIEFKPSEKAEILMWMALCYEGVGDTAAAERMMREALARDGRATLPEKSSPRIAERLEQMRAELAVQAPPPPAPPSPPPPRPIGTTPPEDVAIVPLVLVGAGAASTIASGVLAIVANDRWGASQDTARFADERAQSHGEYLGVLTGAVVLGVVAVAGIGAGAVLLAQ